LRRYQRRSDDTVRDTMMFERSCNRMARGHVVVV
jgi:hypothetical protein